MTALDRFVDCEDEALGLADDVAVRQDEVSSVLAGNHKARSEAVLRRQFHHAIIRGAGQSFEPRTRRLMSQPPHA